MIEDTNVPEKPVTSGITAHEGAQPKRIWRKLALFLGGGCLLTILCFGIAVAVLPATGVLSGTHGDHDDMPSWSPDGDRIAFASDRDGNWDTYVMNADGSNVIQLTRDPTAMLYFIRSSTDYMPAWSPDGRHIAFVSGRDNPYMQHVEMHIYVMEPDGSNVVPLVGWGNPISQHLQARAPAWSPNGKRIAFTSDDAGNWDIYVANADGSNIIPLTHESSQSDHATLYIPAWSPDSGRIAFAAFRKGNWDIYVMNADGSRVLQLTNDSADKLDKPSWSPDGSRIAFSSDRAGSRDIYVMNADGTDVIQLTRDPANETFPSWSPDGGRIAFALERAGNQKIYVMNADGSNAVQLTGK